MAAKRDFDRGREPSQLIVHIVAIRRDGKGRLREVILRRDRLHDAVGKPAVERHDRCRISGQRLLGERIHLKERGSSHRALVIGLSP